MNDIQHQLLRNTRLIYSSVLDRRIRGHNNIADQDRASKCSGGSRGVTQVKGQYVRGLRPLEIFLVQLTYTLTRNKNQRNLGCVLFLKLKNGLRQFFDLREIEEYFFLQIFYLNFHYFFPDI